MPLFTRRPCIRLTYGGWPEPRQSQGRPTTEVLHGPNLLRIAAKAMDVFLHPLQGQHLKKGGTQEVLPTTSENPKQNMFLFLGFQRKVIFNRL